MLLAKRLQLDHSNISAIPDLADRFPQRAGAVRERVLALAFDAPDFGAATLNLPGRPADDEAPPIKV